MIRHMKFEFVLKNKHRMWILVAALVALLVYWWWTTNKKNKRFMQLASKLSGPPPLPIIGNALEYGTNSHQFLSNLMRIADQYGHVSANWLGQTLYVVTYTAEDAEIILSSKSLIDKAEIYKYLKPWLGTGLISANAEKWQKHRKLLTPAFHFKILENYIQTFGGNLNIMLNNLESEINKEEFDVQPHIDRCALDIISETAMATEIRSEKNESAFRSALKKASYAVLYRAFKPWLHPDFLFNWSPTGSTFRKSVETIQDFIETVISKRKREKVKNGHVSQDNADIYFGYKKRMAFIDLLLEFACDNNKHKLTDQEILDEVNTFMFAGHDTTTSAINFTIYMLSRHPEVQEKVVEEINEVFGDLTDKPFTYNDLSNMKYLERVIKETLRLFPSVPYIGRMLNEEVTLHNGDILPIGCSVILLFHKLHRDPKVFPNPEEFNPDNFLPDRLIGRHPFAYCPFSAGPRNCIGQKFAMLELKATVLCIIRKFCILPGKTDIKLVSELIIRSSTGINIALKKREK